MHLALPVNDQALDNLIDAVTSAHSTFIMRHSSPTSTPRNPTSTP